MHVRAPAVSLRRGSITTSRAARHRFREPAAGILARNTGALREQRILADDQPGAGGGESCAPGVPGAVQRGRICLPGWSMVFE
jgi:hypothetical protein